MLVFNSPRDIIRPNLKEMLWHFANGRFPNYLRNDFGPVGWAKYSHRGIQRLDNIQIPRKQKRYVLNHKFEIRINHSFEDVVRYCADISREGRTWISEELIIGYTIMHENGYAHSFEAWQDNRLVGGCFGVHIGGYISVESLFHRADNASKAAYGHMLHHLSDRGFELIDTCCVADHMVNYGEEWVPQWKFDEMLRRLLPQNCSISDSVPAPMLPVNLRLALLAARVGGGLLRRLKKLKGAGEAQIAAAPTTFRDPRSPETREVRATSDAA